MKYCTMIALLIFSFSKISNAETQSCKSLFADSAPIIDSKSLLPGNQFFRATDLDSEIPVLASRANFIRRNGLLDIAQLAPGEKPKQKVFFPLLNKIQKLLEEAKISDHDSNMKPRNPNQMHDLTWSLSRFKKLASEQLQSSPDSEVELKSFSSFIYDVMYFYSDCIGTSTDIPLTVTDSIKISYPTLGSPHPETLMFLFSRGIYNWEVSFKPRALDGSQFELSPYQISNHDGAHIAFATSANRNVSIESRSHFFDRLWNQFINRENQSLRERELAIFLIHHAVYERFTPMSTSGIQAYLENPRNLYQTNPLFLNLLERVTNKNDLSSNILAEAPVTEAEIESIAQKMYDWLLQNP